MNTQWGLQYHRVLGFLPAIATPACCLTDNPSPGLRAAPEGLVSSITIETRVLIKGEPMAQVYTENDASLGIGKEGREMRTKKCFLN
jgi:hypothetical protein